MPDIRTSQLIVMATEAEMPEVEQLIERLDTKTKQVLIEARLLETMINPTTSKGIDWSGTLAAQHVSYGNGVMSGTTTQNSSQNNSHNKSQNGANSSTDHLARITRHHDHYDAWRSGDHHNHHPGFRSILSWHLQRQFRAQLSDELQRQHSSELRARQRRLIAGHAPRASIPPPSSSTRTESRQPCRSSTPTPKPR